MEIIPGGRRGAFLQTTGNAMPKFEKLNAAKILEDLFGYKCRKFASDTDDFELWYPLSDVIVRISEMDNELFDIIHCLTDAVVAGDIIRGTIDSILLTECIDSAKRNGRTVALECIERIAVV